MSEVLFGTTNPNKIKRFQLYFHSLGIQVLSPEEVGVSVNVIEDGTTPFENAIKKARAFYQVSNMPVFAVDYGLFIERFSADKQPGLNVRRIYGDKREVSDDELLDYYIEELIEVGGSSEARWVSAIALVDSSKIKSASFSRKTMMVSERSSKRTPGEPLNSIQIDPGTGKYFTDFSPEEWLELEQVSGRNYIDFMREHFVNE